MHYPGLFFGWTIVIAGGTLFLTGVSVYLYLNTLRKMKNSNGVKTNLAKIWKDFVFVWILLVLLVLYIVSIGRTSAILFAVGNMIVETILLIYVQKNKTSKTQQQ